MSTSTTARPLEVLDGAWGIDPRVSVRPECFGALLYHFGTRRLSFLKDPKLLLVLQALGEHDTAREACAAVGLTDDDLPTYAAALRTLATSAMIRERTVQVL